LRRKPGNSAAAPLCVLRAKTEVGERDFRESALRRSDLMRSSFKRSLASQDYVATVARHQDAMVNAGYGTVADRRQSQPLDRRRPWKRSASSNGEKGV
jgi:hypothetical protein